MKKLENIQQMKMKINERNIMAFATSATPVDREGWLDMRTEMGKTYQKRWFVLKGNLLFFFDKIGDKEPIGVIVLEGCTVELTEEDEAAYSFKIVFHCEFGRTYYMCTNSQASMEAWMKALACASYDYMKLMVSDLQRQLEEIEAEQSADTTNGSRPSSCDEPKVPPRGQRHNPFNKSAENDGRSVPGSRHHKENYKTEIVPQKKVSFREIHTAYGRKILADRNALRQKQAKAQEGTKPNSPEALIKL